VVPHGEVPVESSANLMGRGPFLMVELVFAKVGDMRQNGASNEGVRGGSRFFLMMS
jgi:hypothetical protein